MNDSNPKSKSVSGPELNTTIAATARECQLSNINADFRRISLHKKRPSRLDLINDTELCGATLILDGKLQKGLGFLRKAMELRFEIMGEPPIYKPVTILCDTAAIALKGVREAQTIEELEGFALKGYNSLMVQAQLIYIRILGLENTKTICCLEQHARQLLVYHDPRGSIDYINLIWKCCNVTESNWEFIEKLIALSMTAMVQLRGVMPLTSQDFIFNSAMLVLQNLLTLLEKKSEKCSDEVCPILRFIVEFTYFLVAKPLDENKRFRFKCLLHRAVRLGKRNSQGYDLLLFACLHAVFGSYYFYYHREVISLLLEVGADPNSRNDKNDTAAHILAWRWRTCTAIKTLYDAGAHLELINCYGKTVADILIFKEIPIHLIGLKVNVILQPSLKCLCARAVRSSNVEIQSLDDLPRELDEFLRFH